MRVSTKINPLGLRIGELVKVARIAFIGYNEHGVKELTFSEEIHITCTVVGVVKRALGKYVKGRHYHNLGLDPPDYEQPSLKVSKYVRLYQCKTRLEEKPFLVHPDDVIVIGT